MITYKVPVYRLQSLLKKIDSLNRKAEKIKVPGIIYEVSKPYDYVYTVCEDSERGIYRDYTIQVSDVTFNKLTFKMNGWSFLATIEHRNEGNVIIKTSDVEIPSKYRKTTQYLCEHCKTKRDRNLTYLVYNEKKNKIYQVGSTCIQNYLGFDASMMVAHAAIVKTFTEISEASDWESDGGWGKRAVPVINLEKFLSMVVKLVDKVGYVSSSKVFEKGFGESTGMEVWGAYWKWHNMSDELKKYYETTKETDNRAKKVIEYIKGLDKNKMSDYENNMFVLAQSEYVTYRTANTVASMVPYYNRKMEDIEKAAKTTSNHFGKVGERMALELTLKSSFTVGEYFAPFSKYGVPNILERFEDKNGNVFVWYNKSGKRLEVGKTYKGKATIKAHGEYKGIKQTVISRFSYEG